jgi:phage terminase Nu1 subunit (DNA packaging protein)
MNNPRTVYVVAFTLTQKKSWFSWLWLCPWAWQNIAAESYDRGRADRSEAEDGRADIEQFVTVTTNEADIDELKTVAQNVKVIKLEHMQMVATYVRGTYASMDTDSVYPLSDLFTNISKDA